MIRTKYKVLVPLVEYYEKEDAKKLEEKLLHRKSFRCGRRFYDEIQ